MENNFHPLLALLLFLSSLIALVKSADWLLESTEKIGLKIGLSRFIIGALLVGLGTSLPELSASLAAVLQGETTIVVANAVGSNISNILLVIGFSAVLARRLTMTKNLIELDLPILVLSTLIFLWVAWDGEIVLLEALILLFSYLVYFLYTIFHDEEDETKELTPGYLPAVIDKVRIVAQRLKGKTAQDVHLAATDFAKLLAGIAGLAIGAKYLIVAVLSLSSSLHIAPSIISITAIALGTSLPELFVSARAAMKGFSDMAVGNIFGSNIFNILIVVGIPGLFGVLHVDHETITTGLVAMTMATFVFVLSALSQRIYVWEGILFMELYVLFVLKLFHVI